LGAGLLVAPVIEKGADERRVYLPEGSWRDHWSGITHKGAGWITVGAPLEQIPLFVRDGGPNPL
jgi:alpha-glucosidase (family GH31 glycosyl hydrolase)